MQYDAILIGSGQASGALAHALVGEGQRVALAEGRKLGGTCLNVGCRPTKALRASARVAYLARRAAEFGIHVGEVTVDFKAVMARKDAIIGAMHNRFDGIMRGTANLDIYDSFAHFVGTTDAGLHQVQVGEQVIESARVFINSGARAFIPPIDGIDRVPYLTNVELLALDELPTHLLVVGGGYIGLEFGQMFRRFGSEVTIIESNPHVAKNEDDDVGAALDALLRGEGVQIVNNVRAKAVAQAADGTIELTIEHKGSGERQIVRGSHLLVAVGRVPNSDTLNLGAVGVETDAKGFIKTTPHYETNIPGIWALGDVNGRGAFTHTAYQDYEILLDHLRGGTRHADERYLTYGIFTDPPLGRVGMNEREARESGKNVLMAVYPLEYVSRARLESETHGLIKILVDADTEQILGALAFGMQCDDVIQIFSNFIYTGASYKVMRDALPAHPTIAEFIPTILGKLKPLSEY
jgi:pyruvate/2-oxoglutarate dehydrogenase complex dihydrolipoamide dehydrogenase (E3) component